MRCGFIQPLNDLAEMYVNPLELQRFAGSLLQLKGYEPFLIDFNIRGSSPHSQFQALLPTLDLLCIATPPNSFSFIHALLSSNSVQQNTTVVFVGETVSDGLTEEFLRQFHQWRPIYALVSKSESDFLALVQWLVSGPENASLPPNVHLIDTHGAHRKGSEPQLAPRTTVTPPYFPDFVLDELKVRGLPILLDGLTRGCEHHCNYCRLNSSRQTAGRVQDVEGPLGSVVKKLSMALGRRIYVQLADENFFGGRTSSERTARLRRIQTLARELEAAKYSGMIGVDTRVDTVIDLEEASDQAELRANAWREMAKVGLRYVYLGVETLSKTQVKRYSKALNLDGLLPALQFLDRTLVSYTIGLILLDPLVSIEEIESTILDIERYDLYGNVASLFKEMRIEIRHPYYSALKKHGLIPDSAVKEFLFFDRDDIRFRDERIAACLPITRKIHKLFSENGYRHSDLAAMRAFGQLEAEDLLSTIPYRIGKMEVQVWQHLLKTQQVDPVERRDFALAICKNAVDRVLEELTLYTKIQIPLSREREVIRDYYIAVFGKISLSLRHIFAKD